MADQHHHQDVRTTEIAGEGQYVNPGAELARRAELDEIEKQENRRVAEAAPMLNDDENLVTWAAHPAHPGDALTVTGHPVRVGFEVAGPDGSKQLFVGNARFETRGGVTTVTMDEAEEVRHTVIHPEAHSVVTGDQDPARIAAAEELDAAYRRGQADTVEALAPQTVEAKLLADAARTVNGERQDKYGNAEDSFQVIADFWNTYLCAKYPQAVSIISPFDVAMMMDLMKTARLTQTPNHRDSLVDKAGYVALGYRTLRTEIGA